MKEGSGWLILLFIPKWITIDCKLVELLEKIKYFRAIFNLGAVLGLTAP